MVFEVGRHIADAQPSMRISHVIMRGIPNPGIVSSSELKSLCMHICVPH